MVNSHVLAEHTSEAVGYLRGEGNFRYEIEHLQPSGDSFLYKPDVYFGFTA